MGPFQRLFGATCDAITLPNFVPGSKAVEVSTTMLRELIDRGSAGPDGPNRGRLATLFARGYLFGSGRVRSWTNRWCRRFPSLAE